jgi:peptidoglycan hydrolase-like protein with peptidoglycan-binding domain
MLRFLNAIVVVVFLTLGVVSVGAAVKSTARKTSSASSKSKKPSVSKRTPVRKAAASSKKKTVSSRRTTTSRRRSRSRSRHYTRVGQQKPQPERILEIEQALSQHGFFAGTPDPVWDAESVNALRRFQAQYHIEADGKLTALSVIALGLGPKRGAASPAIPASPTSSTTGSSGDNAGAATPQ